MENSYKNALAEKEMLHQILDNIPVAIWCRNQNMEITYFNNTYSNMVFGYQKPFDSELLEIDTSTIFSAKKAFTENIVNINEKAIIIEGKRYLYQITDAPLVQNSMVISSAWDITNKELVQKELHEVMSSHQNLLESSSNACMIIGPNGKLKYFNDALLKFWGAEEGLFNNETTHEEILDHLYLKHKLPEQYNYAKFRKERTSLTNNLTSPREDLFYLPDGKCLRCVVIPHAGNSLLFTYEDVTEKLELQRLNHTLSAVQKFTIDHLQEGICVFNESGDLELLNSSMSKLWEIEKQDQDKRVNLSEMIDKISGEYTTPAELEELQDSFTKVMVSRIKTQQIIKNFKGHIIHRSMMPLPNRGIMVSDLDVTDSMIVQNALIEKNEALLYVDKIKSEFLANMSYELRSPLTSIMGISQILLLHDFDNLSASQKSYLNNLVTATEDLSKLVDDAIEITTISAGYSELEIEEFDLNELIREAILESRDALSLKNISCGFEHDVASARYKGDRKKIKHAVAKLLENSIYRSKNIKRIDIDLKYKDTTYLLSITDDGNPIDCNPNSITNSTGLRPILAKAIINLVQGKFKSEFSKTTKLSSYIIELPNLEPSE